MDSPAVKGVAITTTPNEAYEQMQTGGGKGVAITTTPNVAYEQMQPGGGKEAEETPQYDDYEKMQQGGDEKTSLVCSPTECPSVTRHPLPAVPSPPNAPTEGVDEVEEEAVYEPIPGDK